MRYVAFPRVVRWRDWSGEGLEHASLRQSADGMEVESVVITAEGFAVEYSLKLDGRWQTTQVRARVIGSPHELVLRRQADDLWFDAAGREFPELTGAKDTDLTVTPLTNTLPVRRLDLQVGQSVEIATAYVDFPSMKVTRNPQRYTCLAPDRYRFESLDSDFVREIEVDQAGLVVNYPGLFRRAIAEASPLMTGREDR